LVFELNDEFDGFCHFVANRVNPGRVIAASVAETIRDENDPILKLSY